MSDIFIPFFGTFLSTFTIVSFAEMGDKSQLACMLLASRYRVWPVFWGAVTAFIFLNLAAVILGIIAASWIPEQILALAVGCLFLLFGYHAFTAKDEGADIQDSNQLKRGIFLSTFLLISVAEFGDKTQIAVAGLASTHEPYAVWAGASMALMLTTGLGVLIGHSLLKNISGVYLHRISGLIFMLFGILSFVSII